jgi:hypothetical protein
VDDRVRLVRDIAGTRLDQVELNALVQRVVISDDRRTAAEELRRLWPTLTIDDVLETPYVLVGSVDRLVDELHKRRERWGISYYVIFHSYMDALAPVVARLAGR